MVTKAAALILPLPGNSDGPGGDGVSQAERLRKRTHPQPLPACREGRLVLLACVAGLAACSPASTANDAAPAATLDPHDGLIECRIGNARAFERFCTVEPGTSESGRTLTLRKPDGGFRRLLVTGDGRGVVAADGAEPARVTILDRDRIEVTIGDDSFRLPARVQAP
ncbi:hypothetical protein [Sphingosinicella terrae]|uniref:hypothetical protein n=1 Tax=Sphingosinicella terrae TaxID=2172047 RepID=UPI000E0CC00D|nr:hypothetical protein [Sphingosinicella terrae]